MQGSLLQRGLGPASPPPPCPQQSPVASTSFSAFSSHIHSCPPFRQHSSSRIAARRQHQQYVDAESLSTFLCSANFGSLAFHGDLSALIPLKRRSQKTKLKGLKPWAESRRPDPYYVVGSSNKSFEQSHQRRGTFLSPGQQSTRTTNFALESNFNYPDLDQTADQYQNSPGSFRPTSLSPPLDVTTNSLASDNGFSGYSRSRQSAERLLAKGRSDQLGSSPIEHKQRIEQSFMVADPAVLRNSPKDAHLPPRSKQIPSSNTLPRLQMEASVMLADQARSSQNGARPALNNYRSPTTSNSQRYVNSVMRQIPSGIPRGYTPYQRRVQQEIEEFRDELRYRREHQPPAIVSRVKCEGALSLQGAAMRGNQVTQLETSSLGEQKWREAAKKIQQNRKPAHIRGRVEPRSSESESVKVELEPLQEFGNVIFRSSEEPPEGLYIHEREEELPRMEAEILPAALEQDVIDSSVREEFVTQECTKLRSDDLVDDTRTLTQADGEPLWTNPEVLVVNTVEAAQGVVEKLRGQYKDLTHACDTEVAGIDPKKESPVGHGCLICFSIYCGPETDFGGGKCRLWVDVLDKNPILDVFKAYFEDPCIKKVWHNYSFDKHILANHGINAKGFHADTMHLARLYDSARTVVQGGYSLEGLTGDKDVMGGHWGELKMEEFAGKRSMKHLFGRPNIKKNGEEGKLHVVPAVMELQTQPEWRDKWIHYSSFDAVCTWCLWKSLQHKLKEKDWMIEGKFKQEGRKMYDFYEKYMQPFGELLVQMEAEGMLLDREHLAKIEEIALQQQEFSAKQFKKWAAKRCPDAVYMNVGSDAQVRQLLFGGKANKNDPNKKLEMERTFKTPNTENYIEEGRKIPKKTRPFTLCGLGVDIPVETYTSAGWPAVGGAALKALAGKVAIDYSMLDDEELVEDLASEACVEDTAVLTSTGVKHGSEEDLSAYGKAYKAFGGQKEGKEACMALAALCEVASINTLISNFIQPLQGNDIKGADGRVHCSLNINTETGRLSARRPSLQNQPALEKDRYKIRQAFVAAPGNSLIVADYGQLELRLLAHLADCKSMLKAFVDGGDFHSRTALNMYPHVRKAVEKGDVILEWEPKSGENQPPVPLLKDVFGAERRKAKMLNFSIAYGKTAMGLSKDWKVSVDEAKATVELWYSDRQEVLRWQQERVQEANNTHRVHTLLGRTRHFPDVKSSSRLIRGHIERAAINTPVQGSAADVAMCAMLEINNNKTLRDLGWKLLLQVHDEVILEGPSNSAGIAKDIVVNCMGFPFNGKNKLRVALAVDAKYAQSWYGAK